MVKVNIEPKIIEWAINRSNKGEQLFKKFSNLNGWLSGENQPTLKQLESFANDTYTPLGYFFLKEVPNESISIPHYRTINDSDLESQSPNLIETIHTMQRRQVFMKEYIEENIGVDLKFIDSYKGNNPLELSSEIRKLVSLPEDWAMSFSDTDEALKFLIKRCEQCYITIMVNGVVGNNNKRKLDVKEFRGFVLVDKIAPLIFINGADAKTAQLFTLIHEVAHLIIGSSAIVEASPVNANTEELEKLCNMAATEFLCPKKLFINIWREYVDNHIVEVSKKFKVSRVVVARRALELNLISKMFFKDFYEGYQKELINMVKKESSGGNFYNTTGRKLGNLFSEAINYRFKSKSIQYTDAYKLTGLKAHTFHNYMNHFENKGGF